MMHLRKSLTRALHACLLGSSLVACSGKTEKPEPEENVTVDAGVTEEAELLFLQQAPLQLTAGGSALISVRVLPPPSTPVRFLVLGEERRAYLNRSIVDTDALGVAEARLTALGAAQFTVRASVGGVSADLAVQVEGLDNTSLSVEVQYDGTRSVEKWQASVHLGKECAELEGNPPPDGELPSSATLGDPVLILRVPLEPTVAVTVRSQHSIGGCRTLLNLPEAAAELALSEAVQIDVSVSDRPLQVNQLDLPLTLGIDSTAEWAGALDTLGRALVTRAVNGQDNDFSALLEAMQLLLGDDEAAVFAARREELNWDELLQGGAMPHVIRDRLQSWMSQGILDFLALPLFEGRVLSASATQENAFLTLERAAGHSPAAVGFPESLLLSTNTQPGDLLQLGGTLLWLPNPLLLVFAEEATAPIASSVPQALKINVSCSAAATTLLGSLGDEAGPATELIAGCDADCARSLCESALDLFWERMTTTPSEVATLMLSVTGPAQVDGDARVVRYDATWRGSAILAGFEELPVQGVASSSPTLDPLSSEAGSP